MKPEPRQPSFRREEPVNQYVGEEDLSEDDEPLLEYASQPQDKASYREYTLRVLPWVDWDTLFADAYAEHDGSLDSVSTSESEEDALPATGSRGKRQAVHEEAQAEFVRREYVLARFPPPAVDAQERQETQRTAHLRLGTEGVAPVVAGGPRYRAGSYARLCREGEETLRERREALAEAERVDAQLADGTAPWYKQRRDLEGVAQIPERYRKRLILEVEEEIEPHAARASPSLVKTSIDDTKASEPPATAPSLRDAERKPRSKRRRVYHGTMDSALGSDYCLMIVRDERTIDLVPVGRYAWYNFKYAPKLSDMANERLHRREARAATLSERTAEEIPDNSPTPVTTTETESTAKPEDDPLLMAERKLKTRAMLADSILERRRHLWDHSINAGGQRPIAFSTRQGEQPMKPEEWPPNADQVGASAQLDPLVLLSRYDSESGTDSNLEDRSDGEITKDFPGSGRQTPDSTFAPHADTLPGQSDRIPSRAREQAAPSPLHTSGSGSESHSSIERLERYQAEDPLLHRAFPEERTTGDAHAHRPHLSENGRMLKRLLERERGAETSAASARDTDGAATSVTVSTLRSTTSSADYAGEKNIHQQDQMHLTAAGRERATGTAGSVASLPALPRDLLPPTTLPIEETHVRAALQYLHDQGVNLTVKEFLSYFQPWFPVQKDRVAAIVRKLCTAREIPPGSGRICVLLKEQAGLPPRSPS